MAVQHNSDVINVPPSGLPENRRSGALPYDDAMLELERVRTLAEVIDDACERCEVPSVSLTTMLRLEIDYLEAAIEALLVRNAAPLVRQLRPPEEVGQFVNILHRAEKLGYRVLVDNRPEPNIYSIAKDGELFLVNVELAEIEAWVARREKGGAA